MGNDNKKHNLWFYVEANVMNIYAKFQLHPPYSLWGEYFLENLPFMLPWQPIKFSDLDKIHMNRRRNISVKLLSKYLQWDSSKCQFSFFFHFKLMATISCHSNQSSYLIGKKKQYYSFTLPIDAICEIWQESASWLQRCRLKMLKTDGQRMPACTINSHTRLRWAKKFIFC